MIRSLAFHAAYWAVSTFFVLTSAPLLALRSRRPLAVWIRAYTQTMVFLMHRVAGVRVIIRGQERLPEGPVVIAAKHQSWGDGFALFSAIDDLAFVTGDHLERFPLVGNVLRKLGAVIVDNCGGARARARLVDTELNRARDDGRSILIYPEGHLAPVGRRYRYKRGVFHLYAAYGRPAAPVATNLGLFWPQQSFRLTPGEAIVEFLDPIPPGLDKETFMARLEDAIETRSLELLGDKRPEGADRSSPALPDPSPARRRVDTGPSRQSA